MIDAYSILSAYSDMNGAHLLYSSLLLGKLLVVGKCGCQCHLRCTADDWPTMLHHSSSVSQQHSICALLVRNAPTYAAPATAAVPSKLTHTFATGQCVCPDHHQMLVFTNA